MHVLAPYVYAAGDADPVFINSGWEALALCPDAGRPGELRVDSVTEFFNRDALPFQF